ncbi:MAG: ATP-binding protein, partial [Saprospiraceae bacterium]
DLHDSLGGLLSTIKLRYDKLIYDNNSVTSSPEHHKVHDLIDEACSEIRNIAHDLKPGALEELGLIDAIQDMLNRYDNSETVIIFQHYGLENEKSIDSEIAIYAYRIIQELVNNASKHAFAKEILVQLSKNEQQLEIIVEDDGQGYDEQLIKKGMGLENIKSRVHYLKGELSVKSENGAGTSTYIVIPLEVDKIS